MRKLLPVLFLITFGFSVCAFAQDVEPYGGIQYVRGRSSCQGFVKGVQPLGLIGVCPREESDGYRVFGGVNVNKYFGGEFGYQDDGHGIVDAYTPTGAYVLTLRAPLTAWDVVGTVRKEVVKDFAVQGHAGVAIWDYKVVASATNFGAKNNNSTFTYGFQLQYKWFIAGYDAILKVGQNNLLVSNQRIFQTVDQFRIGAKYTFKLHK